MQVLCLTLKKIGIFCSTVIKLNIVQQSMRWILNIIIKAQLNKMRDEEKRSNIKFKHLSEKQSSQYILGTLWKCGGKKTINQSQQTKLSTGKNARPKSQELHFITEDCSPEYSLSDKSFEEVRKEPGCIGFAVKK